MADKVASSSGSSYKLSDESYTIPLLHAAKHHSSGVIGLFLGRSSAGSGSGSSSGGAVPRTIEVVEAIPCVHLYTSLSMSMEIALEHVEAYTASSGKGRGLNIVGMYEGRAGTDEGFSRAGEKLLRTLRQGREGFFGFVLDNDRLGKGEWPYQVYLPADSSSVQLKADPLPSTGAPDSFDLPSADLPKPVLAAIRDKQIHRDIADLDDHFEDSYVAELTPTRGVFEAHLHDRSLDWLSNNAAKAAISTAL